MKGGIFSRLGNASSSSSATGKKPERTVTARLGTASSPQKPAATLSDRYENSVEIEILLCSFKQIHEQKQKSRLTDVMQKRTGVAHPAQALIDGKQKKKPITSRLGQPPKQQQRGKQAEKRLQQRKTKTKKPRLKNQEKKPEPTAVDLDKDLDSYMAAKSSGPSEDVEMLA